MVLPSNAYRVFLRSPVEVWGSHETSTSAWPTHQCLFAKPHCWVSQLLNRGHWFVRLPGPQIFRKLSIVCYSVLQNTDTSPAWDPHPHLLSTAWRLHPMCPALVRAVRKLLGEEAREIMGFIPCVRFAPKLQSSSAAVQGPHTVTSYICLALQLFLAGGRSSYQLFWQGWKPEFSSIS